MRSIIDRTDETPPVEDEFISKKSKNSTLRYTPATAPKNESKVDKKIGISFLFTNENAEVIVTL